MTIFQHTSSDLKLSYHNNSIILERVPGHFFCAFGEPFYAFLDSIRIKFGLGLGHDPDEEN